MTSQEPHTQPIADPDVPDTDVIVVAPPAPVFVDSTGRRRRLLRRFAYGFGAFCALYGGLISLSLAGGPVAPSAALPFPDLGQDGGDRPSISRPLPRSPAPAATAPKSVLVNESASRDRATAGSSSDGTAVPERATVGQSRPPRPTAHPTPMATATATAAVRPLEGSPTGTGDPTRTPTDEPAPPPTDEPTPGPTGEPTPTPTDEPTQAPTDEPTPTPSVPVEPTDEPTPQPDPGTTEPVVGGLGTANPGIPTGQIPIGQTPAGQIPTGQVQTGDEDCPPTEPVPADDADDADPWDDGPYPDPVIDIAGRVAQYVDYANAATDDDDLDEDDDANSWEPTTDNPWEPSAADDPWDTAEDPL